jgi:hypothetical protein
MNTINKTLPVWNQPYLSPEPDNSSFYQWGGEPSYLNIGWETAASALYKFQSDGLIGGECTVVGQTSTSISRTFAADSKELPPVETTPGIWWAELYPVIQIPVSMFAVNSIFSVP